MNRCATMMGVASFCVLGICSVAAADASGPSPADGSLSEIVVTAQKREQRLQDVGVTITAVSAAELTAAGVERVGDLTKVVSGFTAASSTDGLPVYSIRGVGFNANQLSALPTVSTYLDEAALPFSAMTAGLVFDLERVEVLKGPQGTFFGQNSTAGSINFITAKPTATYAAAIEGTVERFGRTNVQGFVSGPLSETVNARFAGTWTQGGNWQYSTTRDDHAGAAREGGARVNLVWRPSDALTVDLGLNGYLDHSDTQRPQFVVADPGVPGPTVSPQLATYVAPPHDNRASDWDAGTRFRRDNSFYQSALRADLKLSDLLTLTSLTNFAHYKQNIANDFDGTSILIARLDNIGTAQSFSQELRASGKTDENRITYVSGVNYQRDSVREDPSQQFFQYSPAPDVTAVNRALSHNDSFGLFANGDVKLADRLTLTAGARYSEIRHDYAGCSADTGDGTAAGLLGPVANLLRGFYGLGPTNAYGPNSCYTIGPAPQFLPYTADINFKEHNVSWRGGLNYKPVDDLLIYGLVSRGFKSGGVPVLNATAASQFKKVDQERLTSYEVGVKGSNADHSLSVNLSAFYYQYKDKQLYTFLQDPVFGLVNSLGNIPRSSAKGVDFDLAFRPFRGLTVRSAVTYSDTKIGHFTGYTVSNEKEDFYGNHFNYAPVWSGNGDVEYRWNISANLVPFVGASVLFNSQAYGDLASSDLLRLASYQTFDARFGIASSSRWEVTAWVRNLTDRYFYTNAFLSTDVIARYTGMPRTFGVTVRYTF